MKLIILKSRLPLYFLCLTAFFIPLATAPVNIFSFLTLMSIFWIKEARERFFMIIKDPLSILIISFFGLMLISCFYGSQDHSLAQQYLTKYLRILLIPVFAAAVFSKEDAGLVLRSFVTAAAITALFSYLVYFGIILGEDNTYFKLRITHGFFIALASLWVLTYFSDKPNYKFSGIDWVILFAAVVSLINIFFVADGRTAWLAIFAAISVFALKNLKIKNLVIFLGFFILAVLLLYLSSDVFSGRVNLAFSEIVKWLHGEKGSNTTSMGLRMSFWYYSMKAFELHPVFGYGLGGFRDAVGKFSIPNGFESFQNPHNQYFLFLVQMGVVGLLMYLSILIIAFKRSLTNNWFMMFLVAFSVSSLVNSFNYDFAESYAFLVFMSCFAFPAYQSLSVTQSS